MGLFAVLFKLFGALLKGSVALWTLGPAGIASTIGVVLLIFLVLLALPPIGVVVGVHHAVTQDPVVGSAVAGVSAVLCVAEILWLSER